MSFTHMRYIRKKLASIISVILASLCMYVYFLHLNPSIADGFGYKTDKQKSSNFNNYLVRGVMQLDSKTVIGQTQTSIDNALTNEMAPDDLPLEYLLERSPRNITRKFLTKPTVIKNQSDFFMIFFIKSACARTSNRKRIRSTYASITSINKKRFAFIFLIGVSTTHCYYNLSEEINKFGDILQAEVADEYEALPDKVLAAYQWVYYDVQNISAFYSFTDDDCLMNILNVYKHFDENFYDLLKSEKILCGFHFANPESPARDTKSKYYTSSKIYSNSKFPAFCNGGLTTLTFPILRDIYRVAEVTERNGLSLEDVYITGILRSKLYRGSSNIAKLDYTPAKKVDELVIHLGNNPNAKLASTIFWVNQINRIQNGFDEVLMSKTYFTSLFSFAKNT